ncbi:hypothetical protein DPMN_079687 [Dreissena polymorpha]|uniref:Uncharacterized protein n=1 Tax=Dreissena polymorpha TaxID=45954 RepID=A0A9D4BR70_DREPO|nr:hypothetical protein DPMN_079687 [Dreissena polymorpha]
MRSVKLHTRLGISMVWSGATLFAYETLLDVIVDMVAFDQTFQLRRLVWSYSVCILDPA